MIKRPKKITPDPIIDAVVEFRYESKIPPAAITGVLYAHIKDKYPSLQSLPIINIPEEVRRVDPNLKFHPHYLAQTQNYRLNVGPQVISLSNTGAYHGWKDGFFPAITDLLKSLETSGIVSRFLRLGVRYIDFFESDVYDNINLSVQLHGNPLNALQSTFSALFNKGPFQTRLHVANNVSANVQGTLKAGSVIDTDTFFEPTGGFDFNGLNKVVDECHEESVQFFFDLLKKEFLESLHPEYD